nr:ABC-ATPase domain-containing protein [uncultured Blautia sp.]
MQASAQLKELLHSINRKSYPAYKSLRGAYQFDRYILSIDHVQGDPFASPSHISVKLSHRDTGFPAEYYKDSLTRITLGDFLNRQFEQQVNRYTFRAKGSGKSGLISVSHCGQEVLARTACEITEKGITARFFIGFPANGRTINSPELEKILFDFLPVCVHKAFFYRNLDPEALRKAICLAEDQAFIRQELKKRSLAAFVSDGAILPRESGISSRPMKNSVPFVSPESLRVSMELPHRGTITGMGIPCGITLIVGGGYHGKSTLLNALELGIYDHISGDGREYVITDPSAQKLRSEDGRFIKDVDISLFINDLPNKKDTLCFSTEDASGSTSQAAGIVESMEAGSKVFLLDEDTSATNFMVRDSFMQRVICREKEPITPFLERARDLYEKAGISTILVAGSSGAFFHIADTVIQMDNYHPVDITAVTKKLCQEYPLSDIEAPAFRLPESHRIMTRAKVAPSRHSHPGQPERLKTKVHGKDDFSLGKTEVDLRYVEQLIDSEQTASLALLLKYACEHLIDGKRTLPEIITYLDTQLKRQGLSFFSEGSYIPCGYAMPRIQEIYSCFNRYRRP